MSDLTLHPIVAQLRPSAEQLPAILARGCDVLVSAGAGTGKTRTLTARILGLLAEGVPLRSIVAVTFTIRAASEMRNRLRQQVQTYLANLELAAEERAFWTAIAVQMDAARIGTIHSLCTEILRAHPAEALLDPNFAILDEAQALQLRRAAVDDGVAQLLVSDDAEDARLVETLGVEALRETLARLLNKAASETGRAEDQVRRFQSALDEVAGGVRRFLGDSDAHNAIANLRLALEETRRSDAAALDKAAFALQPTLDAWESAQTSLAAEKPVDALIAALPIGAIKRGLGNKQNWHLHFPKQHYGTLLDLWAEYVALPKESDPRADRALIALLPALLRSRDGVCARYAELKNELRALDFDDLEEKSCDLLTTNVKVRERWQGEVAALLVDEFQDTNASQRDLLRAIGGDRGVLFMVGDAKQSIYRFRGADVSVFRAERERVAQSGGASLPLAHTFRSHAPLLEQLNSLLAGAMERDSRPAADFREPFAPLISGDPERLPRTGAPWIEVQLALGSKGEGALEDAASALGTRLIELHAAGYKWEEMVLLCRRADAFAPYENVFDRAGIPYVTVAGSGFHDRPEVRDLLNALRAIANPEDNRALFGFLRSPVIGFSDAELLALSEKLPAKEVRERTPGAWWKALSGERSSRADRAVGIVQQLNGMAGRATVAEVLKRFLDLTHYEAALMRNSNDRAARNVGKLLEDAQGSPQLSILQFLESIDDLRAARGRASEATVDSIGSVQIMTVHKAKGLEFPIVAIGDAGSKGGGRRGAYLHDPVLGPLLAMKQEDGKSGVLYLRAVELNDEMEAAENDRLLYVASTRAREVLIFNGVASVNQSGAPRLEGWLKAIGGPLGIDDAFARAPRIATLAAREQSNGTDASEAENALRLPLAHGASCLVVNGRVATPEVARLGNNIHSSVFDARMITPVPGTPLSTFDREVELSARDEVMRRIVEQAAGKAPHRVVGILFHAALEEAVDPKTSRYDSWIKTRAATLGLLDEATVRALRQRVATLLGRYYASDLHAKVERATLTLREVPCSLVTQTDNMVSNTVQTKQGAFFAEETPAEESVSARIATTTMVIDLLFRDPDGTWNVVDFKTDQFSRRVRTRDEIARLARYADQVRTYGRAVAQLVRTTPRLWLCLLDDHGAINVREINPQEINPSEVT